MSLAAGVATVTAERVVVVAVVTVVSLAVEAATMTSEVVSTPDAVLPPPRVVWARTVRTLAPKSAHKCIM